MNSTIHGIVENEDVDLFAITATKGQRISVDVEAMRLGTFLFDPYVAILDDKRFELATVDDAPIAKQDGILSILAPADGRYFVQVRETSYGGNGNCRYRLHVGTFPRPSAVYPSGESGAKKSQSIFSRMPLVRCRWKSPLGLQEVCSIFLRRTRRGFVLLQFHFVFQTLAICLKQNPTTIMQPRAPPTLPNLSMALLKRMAMLIVSSLAHQGAGFRGGVLCPQVTIGTRCGYGNSSCRRTWSGEQRRFSWA